ncbi:FUSC family protein [Labedaea rhizosphaerae]|nr:FUSC family protein [Labedaea rhizosphaerae]
MRTTSWVGELWDRFVAWDPGLGRLRLAVAGALSMASALGVEFAIFSVAGAAAQTTLVATLLGSVVAMMGSMALLNEQGAGTKILTAAFFPVAIGVGILAGVAVGGHTDLMLAVFVAVMFVAVFVRRFGVAFFFYGFMTWMGYFFAAFLKATMATVPTLLIAVGIGTAWVLLLSLTFMRTNPLRTLGHVVRAFDARARAVARAGADLLEDVVEGRRTERARRALRRQQDRLADVALLVEGWSGEPGALPEGWSGPALRRRLIDAHQGVDTIAAAALALADGDRGTAREALRLLDRLARHDDAAAARLARNLTSAPEHWPARHLAVATLEFVELAASRSVPPPAAAEVDEFEPAVSLAMGNLPGSASVAADVPARGGRWNPLARVDLTTRQAVQVAVAGALAIVLGRELDTTRYYWAVIAAFVMFAGTATRSESFIKGVNRVVGTLVGLFASIWLADLTSGSTALVLITIVASMFFGFYLLQVSYVYMIFFVTIMVGQLYTVLHQFSDGLLVLRLEETAVGALAGFVVALVVLPLSTRDTVRTARDGVLTALAELLDAASQCLAGECSPAGLDARSRGLDDRVRGLALVAKPLTRPLVWRNSPSRTRHRLTLYAALAGHARALTVALRRPGPRQDAERAAQASRSLAAAATELTAATPGRREPAAERPLADADAALFDGGCTPEDLASDPVRLPLIHLQHLLCELAEPGEPLSPRPLPTAAVAL